MNFRSHILGNASSSQECPRYYQAVFLALYELIINENMQLDDEQKFIAQLGDSVQRSMVQTEGAVGQLALVRKVSKIYVL